ncbi:hypothetical protein PLEOSDRAFT_165612 [Pleurotus ostreatus PC15]|uniref:Uncharacterized protein n=1 Tax=Pleurotus ostreatus (strain PC15) TaxID=1137138 RepID=A0A067NPC5_PLEO1|nr:hypothetical protein PLEOSDRAFT_165612 [Pleurotus ostreatus PC15]
MPGHISSPNPGSGSDGCFATLSEILNEEGGMEGQRDKKRWTRQGDSPSEHPNGDRPVLAVFTLWATTVPVQRPWSREGYCGPTLTVGYKSAREEWHYTSPTPVVGCRGARVVFGQLLRVQIVGRGSLQSFFFIYNPPFHASLSPATTSPPSRAHPSLRTTPLFSSPASYLRTPHRAPSKPPAGDDKTKGGLAPQRGVLGSSADDTAPTTNTRYL